jgi:hypothetical protein
MAVLSERWVTSHIVWDIKKSLYDCPARRKATGLSIHDPCAAGIFLYSPGEEGNGSEQT